MSDLVRSQWRFARVCCAAVLFAAFMTGATEAQQGPPPSQTTPPVVRTFNAGQVFDDCNGARWCPRMVAIERGAFTMGSPDNEPGRFHDERQRGISIGYRFAVSRFEVTFNQWMACVRRHGCESNPEPSDQGWGRGDRPVINVSWDDAQEYVRWLRRETGQAYRLLTEAEWEYVARAGSRTAYPWGPTASHSFANYGADTCCVGIASGHDQWAEITAPVGQFPPNAFGVHDMHGNVLEWVEDCSTGLMPDETWPRDGSAHTIANCDYRVQRGGSWRDDPPGIRSAKRLGQGASGAVYFVGFRIARTLNQP